MSHDSGYKLLFSHPEMVRDLLIGYVQEPWVAELDFATLEKVGGSYISDDLRTREDDLIWRVRHREKWLYVYLLLEFQSTVEPFMAVRLMGYIALLYQDLLRQGQVKRGGRLPPVLPLVLYNGQPPWRAATDLDSLIQPAPKGLERYRPSLQYLLLDENRLTVPGLGNLADALFNLEQSRTPEDMRRVLAALIDWLVTPEQSSLRRAFTIWLHRVLLPARMPGVMIPELNDLNEVQTMLTEHIRPWTEDWKQQGLEEGRAKGLAEGLEEGRAKGLAEGRAEGLRLGAADSLLKLLRLKFGPLPDWANEKVQSADAAQLDTWIVKILTAESIKDVLD